MKKSRIFLIISLSVISVLIVCIVLAIVLTPKTPMQIIRKKTGITFQESAEIVEFDCEKNGTFEATVRIRCEDKNALENQLLNSKFAKMDKLPSGEKKWLPLVKDGKNYSFFDKDRCSKISKSAFPIWFLIIPETESDYCMIYIYYMGGR